MVVSAHTVTTLVRAAYSASTKTPLRKLVSLIVLFLFLRQVRRGTKVDKKMQDKMMTIQKQKKVQAYVDAEFWRKIKKLFKICLPNWYCKEARYSYVLFCLLVARTILSIWIAEVNGTIVKAIVEKDFQKFLGRIFVLAMFAIPSSTVNSSMTYMQGLLALCFRSRLTEYFHSKYLKKMFYYKICNLDCRISNPDQRLT